MAETTIKPKNSYELYMLLSPSAIEGDISAVEEKISQILQKHSAQIERSEKFAKKDLAYPIQKSTYAYAANIYFFAPAESIKAIQDNLNTEDIPLLRFLVSRVDTRAKAAPSPRRTRQKPEAAEGKRIATAAEKELQQPKVAKEAEEKEPQKIEKVKESAKKDTEEDKDKVTLEEIDKRLDEIMEQL